MRRVNGITRAGIGRYSAIAGHRKELVQKFLVPVAAAGVSRVKTAKDTGRVVGPGRSHSGGLVGNDGGALVTTVSPIGR